MARLLKDLLEEDQEPFQLQSYISDLRCQINRPVTHLQVKKRKNAGLPSRFCRNACFLSLRESPDPKKSPLFELKSPNRGQIAILLEAAVRIQKQSSKRTRNAGNAFGLFGSVLKKLTHRKKREINGGVCESKRKEEEEKESSQTQTQFSRRSSSSGVWSESKRSWDVDFCCSSESDGSDQIDEFECELMNGSERFCESPFHFVLQTRPSSSSSGFKTPNFSSPAVSPRRDCRQEMKKDNYEVEKLKKLEIEEEEEDKEQNSPVSVLDTPFEDDDEDIHMDDDDNNITSSFRSVQKAKHLLLQKLRRFEQIAGLDSIELEERISEQETEDEEEEEIVTQRVVKTYSEEMNQVSEGIEALISDLVTEELQSEDESAIVANKVIERLRSWRDVESNTIDMMVEHDFRIESLGLWRSKNDEEEVAETVLDMEFEIFEDLIDELTEEIGE